MTDENQVLLVSEQPMPNFLPLLSPERRPASVTLVVSDAMRARGEWLKACVKRLGIRVEDDIKIDNAADIAGIQEALVRWQCGHGELSAHSVLNVTGGTKAMAIAAQEVFRLNLERPVFYVDIATDKVSYIDAPERNYAISRSATIAQTLALHGVRVAVKGERGRTVDIVDASMAMSCAGNGGAAGLSFRSELGNPQWRRFYDTMAADMRKWESGLGYLNLLAQASAEEGGLKLPYASRHAANVPSVWRELRNVLLADGLIAGAPDAFADEDARRFCNGIWIEHLVFCTLKRLGFDKDHALMNVFPVDKTGNENEIDAMALSKNTLYVFECKTRTMTAAGVADAAVYKLAQLAKSYGLRAKGVLVSARTLRKADLERARAYGVEVVDDLHDLESRLRAIMRL